MVMHEVKVLVPEDRLADFYTRFGTWLAESNAAFGSTGASMGSEAPVQGTRALTDSPTETHAAPITKAEHGREPVKEEAGSRSRATKERGANSSMSHGIEGAKQASDRAGAHDADLLDGAVEWWRSLKRNERDIFTLFMDAAPKTLGATEIVAALGLKSERVIPGVLAWPRRKAARAGFPLAWKFEHDADGKARYGLRNMPEVSMSATDYAALLREAKRKVEG